MTSNERVTLDGLRKLSRSRLGQLALLVGFASAILLFAAACQSGGLEPPRVATVTAQAALTPTSTPTPLVSNAPTATPGGAILEAAAEPIDNADPEVGITVWAIVSDNREMEILQSGVNDFTEGTGIQVKLVQVSPRLMPDLMQSAVISETVPDLVLHPMEYTHGWIQQGILDSEAATAVLDQLDRGTFETGALTQLSVDPASDAVAALPSSGWQQLILYRTDWFEQLELPIPDTFGNLEAAAEAIHEEDSPIAGLIVPTDSSLVSTQQVWEHMAIANGCRLVDQAGEILLLHPACLEALEYYRALINAYSPIGLQTDVSALNGYLSGRTGIIVAPPAVLPIIAGLSADAQPSCPECVTPSYLASNTGIVTTLSGDGEFSQPSKFSALTALGITTSADSEASAAFANYWFDTLYPEWISVNPESKVPLRRGTPDDETHFLDIWSKAPMADSNVTLAEMYGPEASALLSQDIASDSRWAMSRGQGSLLTTIYQELLFAPLLQDMLSGYFSSSETIVEMYLTAVDAVPGYAFPIQVAPSPTP